MFRAVLALVAAPALIVVGVPATSAATGGGSGSASSTLGSISMAIDQIDLDGSGRCIDVKASLDVVTMDPGTYWSLEFSVGPSGAVPSSYGGDSGTGSAKRDIEFQYCPGAYKPVNTVVGEIEFTYYGDEASLTSKADVRFDVSAVRAATQTTITSITRDSVNNAIVKGRLTTTSTKYGRVGVIGTVDLLMQKGKRWVKVGEGYTSDLGEFTAYPTKIVSRSANFRVAFAGSNYAAPSSSKPRRG